MSEPLLKRILEYSAILDTIAEGVCRCTWECIILVKHRMAHLDVQKINFLQSSVEIYYQDGLALLNDMVQLHLITENYLNN